jgi:hypothetical protein
MGRSLMVGFVFFAIFVAGIITGGFLMARWVRNNPARWQRNGQQPAIAVPIGPMLMRRMINQLDLSRDQRKAAIRIIVESSNVVGVLRSETDRAVDRMQDDIDKILTPEQRVELGKLKDDQRVRVLDQREKVHHFLQQLHSEEAVPASGGSAQPPPPATGTQTRPATAPVEMQTQSAVAH